MLINEKTFRVYYKDTDAGGVVYYAKYLEWLEIGRTEILRAKGITFDDFDKKNLIAPVASLHIDYRSGAKYNDELELITTIENLGNSSIKFSYKLKNKVIDILILEGYTVNVVVDTKTMKPCPIPDDWREKLSKF